jgi:hypothetical protein
MGVKSTGAQKKIMQNRIAVNCFPEITAVAGLMYFRHKPPPMAGAVPTTAGAHRKNRAK